MRIAIIEDNEHDSDQYREIIEAAWEGVEVVQLFNEPQAKTAFTRVSEGLLDSFDLITLDIDLSDGDPTAPDKIGGYRLLGDINGKSLPQKNTTVIVVSGVLSPQLVELIQTSRLAVDTLAKPHTLADYLRTVRLGYQSYNHQISQPGFVGTKLHIQDLVLDPLIGPPQWNGKVIHGCKTLTHQRIISALALSSVPLSIEKLKRCLTSVNPSSEAVVVQIAAIRKALSEAGGNKEYPIATCNGAYQWIHQKPIQE